MPVPYQSIFDGFIAFAAIIALSLISSLLVGRDESISRNVFMISLAIGIAVLVWIPIISVYFIIISFGLLVLVLFTDD